MKKIFMTMLAAVAVTASFAQGNPKIAKEIKATKDFVAGKEVLKQQFETLTDEQKGQAYAELYKLALPAAQKSAQALEENKTAEVDYKAIANAVEMAAMCDKFNAKNAKEANIEMMNYRPQLVNAANQTSDLDDKLLYSLTYINSANPKSLEGVVKGEDPYVALSSFFACVSYYQKQDFKNAAKFAKAALPDERVTDNAEQIYLSCIGRDLNTKQDTVNYINALKDLNADKYFQQICLLNYYIGEKDEVNSLINKAITENKNTKVAYLVRGTMLSEEKKFDEAIEDYKKVVEADPEFVSGWEALAVCYTNKAAEIEINHADKNGRVLGENLVNFKAALDGAVAAYEKVRELDPNHEKVYNWPMQLRSLYTRLGQTAKAEEISKLLGE